MVDAFKLAVHWALNLEMVFANQSSVPRASSLSMDVAPKLSATNTVLWSTTSVSSPVVLQDLPRPKEDASPHALDTSSPRMASALELAAQEEGPLLIKHAFGTAVQRVNNSGMESASLFNALLAIKLRMANAPS